MLELMLVVAFTGHLIAVNIAAAGPLFCVALEWRATRRGDLAAAAAARRLAIMSLVGFVVGIAIGGVLLAILWQTDREYWSALGRVAAYRWWFFGGELVFYLACMGAYVALWQRVSGQRWLHRLLAVFAATNLLYHFPPLFTMLSLLSTRPELSDAVLDRSLYVRLFTDGETLARVAHHWLSSLATAAVAVMLLSTRKPPAGEGASTEEGTFRAVVFGARVALAATVLQAPVGLWLLLASPARAQSQLLGSDAVGTGLFVGAIVAMVMLVQQLAAAGLGDDSRGTAVKAAVWLLAVLLLMSGVLHRTREAVHIRAEVRTTAWEGIGCARFT